MCVAEAAASGLWAQVSLMAMAKVLISAESWL